MKILVIEDHDAVRQMIAGMLRGDGHEVVTAANLGEAIARFLEGGIDMITLDERLPGVRGSDLHKILSQEFGARGRVPDIAAKALPPTLFITAFPEDQHVTEALMGENVIGVLPKPFTREQLVKAVGDARGRADA